jgi:hypothetical protein
MTGGLRWLRAIVRIDGVLTVSVAIEQGATGATRASRDTGEGTRIFRTGTLAPLQVATSEDPVVVGFRTACERARRQVPQILEIRAHSELPLALGSGALAAAHLAGEAAANTLLGLGHDERDGVSVSVRRECEAERELQEEAKPRAESRWIRELRRAFTSAAFAFAGIRPQ